MTRYRYMLGVGLAAAIAAAGCLSLERGSPTAPESSGVAGLVGNWASTNALPSRDSCGDFRWNVSERTATSASGSFSATCAGDLHIQGMASGTLSGDVINWNANATASNVPAVGTCTITLGGTARLRVDSVEISFDGHACGVPVSGVETLKRR